MKTGKGHVTYCTNIHTGESWPDHFASIRQNFPAIKRELSPNAPMGIGLRLSGVASAQLIEAGELDEFKKWLLKNDAYVFTMNGFPFGGFHNTVVKDDVHAPDWLSVERLEYTKCLFNILAELLPEGMDGGVSTSPLSYRHWFPLQLQLLNATSVATQHIVQVALHLVELHRSTGKLLHLDIEPEPDGILETGEEFISWFLNELLPAGVAEFTKAFDVSKAEAENMIKQHICLCYDVCHFAIGYEQHTAVLQQLKEHGIRIGKFQVSAALKALMPSGEAERRQIKNAFTRFNEPTYLHQVIAKTNNGRYIRYRDLPQALADAENAEVNEWRAHFHVPIFEKDFGLLQSTQNDIEEVVALHNASNQTNHLEVETYTWDVLSPSLKLPLQQSIIRELKWLLAQLS